MTAYWINTFVEISDEAKLQRYVELAGPAMRAAGGRFLARGNPAHALEEASGLRTTLIEFPSVEAARAAYDSEGYQQALAALGDGARREIRIVDAAPAHTVDLVEYDSPSADAAAASGAFFEQVFGWRSTAYGPTYVDLQGGGAGFGFQADPDEATGVPLAVIRSGDLDATRAAIEAAGGTVTREPFDFPGGRRFHFREPGGAELAVWRPA